jgi:tripartite-type tricarboxylate transporter receptor subunit TctC
MAAARVIATPFAAPLAALLLCATGVSAAHAQEYPARPLRLIVPYPPGGGADFLSRVLGPKVTEHWGQSVIVDNRGGGSGVIGVEIAARAAPDGYTLLVAISAIVANAAINPRSAYDPVRDFTPLMLMARSPYRVVIYPGLPANTLQEWVALAKAKPGAMSYGSAGAGSAIHLSAELFRMQAGISMVHVPYKGTGPAMFAGTLSAAPHVKSGRIRALAVTSLKRRADAPDLPTVAETVVPGYEAGEWFAVFAPAGLPRPIIDKLYGELVRTMSDAEMKERLIAGGLDFVASTSAELADVVKRDYAKWSRLVREAGLKAD